MPRQSRIDAPGALHHIILRGIERKTIFRDGNDKDFFLKRLGSILTVSNTSCFAWVLMDNHVHMLLRTGDISVSTVMSRLLTGYAIYFNRKYRRHGQLFQNRFKSILCEEDPYFLELVRYIHLNPLRAKIVNEYKDLKAYPYSGHGVIMGKYKRKWQNINYVLNHFGESYINSKRSYSRFVSAGIKKGKRPDLTGGGLVRSAGGWSVLKELSRNNLRIKGDERILGESDFVLRVLERAEESFKNRILLKDKINLDLIIETVAMHYDLEKSEIKTKSKERAISKARAIICYIAVRKLEFSCVDVALELGLSPSTVSKAIIRGKKEKEKELIINKIM
ncbi:MAG: transposase [Desulfobacterales bacterium]|nr:transposase [Desulfobacterales bacterium]